LGGSLKPAPVLCRKCWWRPTLCRPGGYFEAAAGQSEIKPIAKAAIGTVQSDIHDIGKNMVMLMLQGAGFEVVDLGVNAPPEKFIQAVNEGAQLVGMSALLTTTMVNIPMTIEKLAEAGVRDRVKIIIGGAPLTQEFADQAGADGFAADASQAVTVAKALLGV
jgi:5-methyltetrahydrofolate--homocysteine methyltransferase